jgi:hypothetical protein
VEPSESFIGREQQRLYDLEAARNATIVACAKEWLAIKGLDDDRYWPEALPQALFDTLESYSPQYSIIAAEAFLKQFGWKIERPSEATSEPIKCSEIAVGTTMDEFHRRLLRDT